jgi:hypothetical protein
MDKNDPVFQEFTGYWQLSEEMITKASKEDLAKSGEKLVKFRVPLDSVSDYGIIDTNSNSLVAQGDCASLLSWIAESGILKPYEQIAEEA